MRRWTVSKIEDSYNRFCLTFSHQIDRKAKRQFHHQLGQYKESLAGRTMHSNLIGSIKLSYKQVAFPYTSLCHTQSKAWTALSMGVTWVGPWGGMFQVPIVLISDRNISYHICEEMCSIFEFNLSSISAYHAIALVLQYLLLIARNNWRALDSLSKGCRFEPNLHRCFHFQNQEQLYCLQILK